MGRARVISGGTGGLYRISRVIDRGTGEQRIEGLQDKLVEAEDVVLEMEEMVVAATSTRDAALVALQEAASAEVPDLEQVEQAQVALTESDQALLRARGRLAEAQVRHMSLQKEIDRLREALDELPEEEAWCADLTETLTGYEVGTIEINGEARAQVLITPGGSVDTALGDIQPTQASVPSGVFTNAALFPAWQRWMPTYRIAEVLSLNHPGNTANVRLRDDKSSAQELPINPENRTLNNVPVEYMTINSKAFEVADRVVVRFRNQKWDNPVVIGFEDNPGHMRVYGRGYDSGGQLGIGSKHEIVQHSWGPTPQNSIIGVKRIVTIQETSFHPGWQEIEQTQND